MLNSLTNYFRSAVRQIPRLRPTAPTGPGSSRWFCASAATRNARFDSSAGQQLYNAVSESAGMSGSGPATRQAVLQDFQQSSEANFRDILPQVTNPGWYTRGARVRERWVRRKPWKLGPGAEESRRLDPFYQLGINPLHEATNSRLLSHFVTEMGKIKSRAETQLTWKSQRRLAKAIRRARMMGVIPALSRRTLLPPLRLGLEHQGRRL